MKVQSVRFTDGQWGLILRTAAAEGMGAAHFIRQAAFAQAIVLAAEHREEMLETWLAVVEALREHPDLLLRLEHLPLYGEPTRPQLPTSPADATDRPPRS